MTTRSMTENNVREPLAMRHVVQTWWPLAASWLFMAIEGPMMSAVVARLADPEMNLAAWGGIVWPLALLIESPIIMLLSASTALSKDWDSYCKLRRFMMVMSAALTVLHILVAFTPLYYVVVVGIFGVPAEIIEPGRVGMMIMVPWTWAIAYRRFNQGVMIRFGQSRAVGLGTVVRLAAGGLVLAIGYLIGTIPGIIVSTCAIATGVVSEALYTGLRVRPVLRGPLKGAASVEPPLTLRAFLVFYIPLAITALLGMLSQPMVSAGLSRMPNAVDSLAAWSVVSGFVFMLRSTSYAFNEVVIALLDEPHATRQLRRFAIGLAMLTSGVLLTIVATPLAAFWFGRVSALSSHLVVMARIALWVALPVPGLNVFLSWYQGTIVHSRHTRTITEAVAAFLLSSVAVLLIGILWQRVTGLYVGLAALGVGLLMQTSWLWWRSRPTMRALHIRDEALFVSPVGLSKG
ncbi:MAG: hypothetical protein GY832_22780 [Chloroflexi bacterium]|nr:hypothetical protein [Chloroflexota bacterium]